MKHYNIKFLNSDKNDLCLPEGASLSEHLTAVNSPILFGCRAGICGSCLCEITPLSGQLTQISSEEQDTLALYAPKNTKARLACQIELRADIAIKKIEPYE